jgi:DNA-binding NarL/FixJ family response regulator
LTPPDPVLDAPTARILIAASQALLRDSLGGALHGEQGLDLIGQAADDTQTLAQVAILRPDVVLVDADLSGLGGIRTTAAIMQRGLGVRVLFLTDSEDLDLLVRAVMAGASGSVTKQQPVAELITAIRAVASGDAVIPLRLLGPLLARLADDRRLRDDGLRTVLGLTRREREVLAGLVEGRGRSQIADALGISPQTAKSHIQNVLTKLGVHSRLEAAAFVASRGIEDELVPMTLGSVR